MNSFERRMGGNSLTFCDVLDLPLVPKTLSKSPAARRVWIHDLSRGESSVGIQEYGEVGVR